MAVIWLVDPSAVLLPAFSGIYERMKCWNLTKLDQHISEMMITTGNKF